MSVEVEVEVVTTTTAAAEAKTQHEHREAECIPDAPICQPAVNKSQLCESMGASHDMPQLLLLPHGSSSKWGVFSSLSATPTCQPSQLEQVLEDQAADVDGPAGWCVEHGAVLSCNGVVQQGGAAGPA